MSELVEILEGELENAFEIKDRKSVHRYVVLMVDNVVGRREHEATFQRMETGLGELRSDVVLIADRMQQGFERMDQRFESMQRQMDERFESVQRQMDERFESVQRQMDERFTATDKRFDDINRRFEDVNTRFDDVNKRFDDVNKRFDDVNKRFAVVVGLMSTFFVILAGMMTAMRIFG